MPTSPRSVLEPRAWLAAIIESSDDAIVSKTLDGVITSWNNGAERMFGYSAAEAIGRSITMIIPKDRLSEENDILAKLRRGERVDHFETVRQGRDGKMIEVSVTVSPVRDKHGTIQGASKILRDISAGKRSIEQLNLLLREMDHRIKNLFALTLGLVQLSAHSAKNKEDLAASVSERIAALARAHALTLPVLSVPTNGNATANLIALLDAILKPYSDQVAIELTGDDVTIDATRLSSLALMLNEFATNAAKYGALSSKQGSLTVQVSTRDENVRLVWTEKGGPAPAQENWSEGFGSTLEAASLSSLNGNIERDWKVEGLVIVLTIPIHEVSYAK